MSMTFFVMLLDEPLIQKLATKHHATCETTMEATRFKFVKVTFVNKDEEKQGEDVDRFLADMRSEEKRDHTRIFAFKYDEHFYLVDDETGQLLFIEEFPYFNSITDILTKVRQVVGMNIQFGELFQSHPRYGKCRKGIMF